MAKEFGNGAIGIILFCMLENKELEEFELDKILNENANKEADETKQAKRVIPDDDSDDFDWI